MDRDEALSLLRVGHAEVDKWNWYRLAARMETKIEDDAFAGIDLRGIDLRGIDLRQFDFRGLKLDGADLSGANLSGAKLMGTRLIDANLTGSRFSGADLRGANLQRTVLANAYIEGTDLREVQIVEAVLDGCELNRPWCGSTRFGNLDLSSVRGLDTVEHFGPSTLGADTLIRSRGEIPEAFLRGCGLPDAWIANLKALIGAIEPIQFYSVFVSYSHKDEDFARHLHSRLRDEGIRVWYAPEDIKGGEKIHEQIDRAIQVFDKLLLVLSENSLGSEWVMTEIRKARKAERREGRRKLFPIRLVPFETLRDWECFDADSGKDLGVEIREYFVPDFSRWKKHDHFDESFARLLRDLKAEDVKVDDERKGPASRGREGQVK